jgi:hypothetical protein
MAADNAVSTVGECVKDDIDVQKSTPWMPGRRTGEQSSQKHR